MKFEYFAWLHHFFIFRLPKSQYSSTSIHFSFIEAIANATIDLSLLTGFGEGRTEKKNYDLVFFPEHGDYRAGIRARGREEAKK